MKHKYWVVVDLQPKNNKYHFTIETETRDVIGYGSAPSHMRACEMAHILRERIELQEEAELAI